MTPKGPAHSILPLNRHALAGVSAKRTGVDSLVSILVAAMLRCVIRENRGQKSLLSKDLKRKRSLMYNQEYIIKEGREMMPFGLSVAR